jgi:glucokinase
MSSAGTPLHVPLSVVADIGGTRARFAVASNDGQLQYSKVYMGSEFATVDDAVSRYLDELPSETRTQLKHICMAVAAALSGDQIKLTNHQWQFSLNALSHKFFMPVSAVNDFSAQAWCLTRLQMQDVVYLQHGGQATPEDWQRGTRTVVGPGTGFGGASITINRDVLESEPGHVGFSPVNERQLALLQQLWQWYPRVSVEHLISGPGLCNIHRALCAMQSRPYRAGSSAASVVELAQMGDALAIESLLLFSEIFGAVCGDIALSVGSQGGFFLSGDMLTRMGRFFDHDRFRFAFNNKGPFAQWCSQIPVAHLRIENPGLRGCAIYASQLSLR